MKLGTDSVILGAYVQATQSNKILDIGTGTGILSLMMAQQSNAIIQAVELDELAAEEAQFNFEQSPWSEQIKLFKGAIQEFTLHYPPNQFDLIISNPPYFTAGHQFEIEQQNRRMARHTHHLSFDELAKMLSVHLTDQGIAAIVLPTAEAETFMGIAHDFELYPKEVLKVFPKLSKPYNRMVILFSKEKQITLEKELIIYKEDHTYTQAYYELTKEYYLWKDIPTAQ